MKCPHCGADAPKDMIDIQSQRLIFASHCGWSSDGRGVCQAVIGWSALADELDAAPRLGGDVDAPEGTRYVQISDTLLRKISARLRRASV